MSFLTTDDIVKRWKPSQVELAAYLARKNLPSNSETRKRAREYLAARKARQQPGREYSFKQPIVPWQIVYGRTRVPGAFAFVNEAANHAHINLVLLIAGHEIQAINRLFLDTDEVIFGSSPDPRWSTQFVAADGVTTRAAPMKVFMSSMLGSPSQTVNADLIGQVPSIITASDKWANHAGAYLIFVYDVLLFPDGLPDILFEVQGKKVYDPRTDTTYWAENAALIAADFLMDTKIGFGVPSSKIDMDQLEAAADICGELVSLQGGGTDPRYSINGYFDTSDDKDAILEQMAQAMAGRIIYAGGKWKIKPGAYSPAIFSLGDDDWLSPLQIQTKPPRAENFNAIKGTYVASDRNYEEREFPVVNNNFYRALDNNELVMEDVQLPFTVRPSTAQRLAKIMLEETRQGITVSGRAKLRAFEAEVGDCIGVTRARLGWTSKEFLVLESKLAVDSDESGAPVLGVDLLLKETAAGVYAWNNGEETNIDLSPNTNLPNPLSVTPPTGLTLTSGTTELYLRADGTVFSRIKVAWNTITDPYVSSGGRVEIQYKQSSAEFWSSASSVLADLSFTHILDVQDGVLYDVRIRSVNAAQVPSSWVTVTGHLVVGKSAPPSNVEQLAAQISGFSIELFWPAVPDLDLYAYQLRVGSPSDSWEQAQVVDDEILATSFVHQLESSGTYRFFIKAVDTSQNVSATAAVVDVAIAAPSAVTLTQTISGPDVTLKWTESIGAFAISQYEVTQGLVYGTSVPVASVKGTTHTRKVNWGGVQRFWVTARDVAGNLGVPASIDVAIVPPAGVQALSGTPIDNNVRLTWQIPNLGTLPIERYEIRRGDVYAEADILGYEAGTISVFPELTGGQFTYWVTPEDTAANPGVPKGTNVLVSAPPDYQLLDDLEVDPGDGTATGVVVVDEVLDIVTITTNPTEIFDIIANPGMGLQTTQKSLAQLNAESPPKNPLGLPSEAEVYRILWPEVNTADGVYDWTTVDTAIRNARASNQRIGFRVITNDESNTPSGTWWLQSAPGSDGYVYLAADDGGVTDQWAPLYSNSTVRTKLVVFLAALGAHEVDGIRVDQHPNIASVDTGIWGLFGENHYSGALISPAYTTQVPDPAEADQDWIVDQIYTYFPNHPIVACVDALPTLDYTVNTKGGGWRADGVGNPWHMNNLYPNRIAEANLLDAWRTGNVEFEPYFTINTWVSNGWDVAGILNWMLSQHAMTFNAKNIFNPPAAVQAIFMEFLRKLGYRHVLRSLEHQQAVSAGVGSSMNVLWKNAGVAMSHYGHKVAFKLSKSNGTEYISEGREADFEPGDASFAHTLTLPTYVEAGEYTISAGVIDKNTRKPDVKMAISGRDSKGWYPVSTIQVVNSSPQFNVKKFASVGIYGAHFIASAGTIKTRATQEAATWDDFLEEWRDQTGNNRHWYQLGSGKKPQLKQTTINSLPGILFDGSNDNFLGNEFFELMFSNVVRAKLFVVMRCLTQNAANHILAFGGRARMLDFEDAGPLPTVNYNIGGRRLDADAFSSQTSTATHGNNVTQLRTIDFNWGAKSMALHINGSNSAPVISNTNWQTVGSTSDTAVACALGANSAGTGDFANMQVAELVIAIQESAADSFLSAADNAAIESDLGSRYSITLA